jgi:DNA-binding transcriptional ArsR family regulator
MANHSEQFAALADPTRRSIFERLARRPRSVGELAEMLPVSRPAVSQHLKVLRDAGLVEMRSEGARNHYAVNPRGIEAMRSYLDRFWGTALESFKSFVEQEEDA